MTQPYFSWDDETGNAICLIQRGNDSFYGSATCAPEDIDMKSEKTGCEIAYRRAYIALLQKEKEKLNYRRQGLQHYQSTLGENKLSKSFDDKIAIDSTKYMLNRLNKEIQNLINEVNNINCKIEIAKTQLREYLQDKDDFYKYIRNKRQGKSV